MASQLASQAWNAYGMRDVPASPAQHRPVVDPAGKVGSQDPSRLEDAAVSADCRRAHAAASVEVLALRLFQALASSAPPRGGLPAPKQASVAICEPCHATIVEDGEFTAGTTRERNLAVTPKNYRRLARLFCALDLVHQLNSSGRSATQRELYYRACSNITGSLFRSQLDMNLSIRDAIGALRIGRPHLGIYVTEKGLLAGAVGFKDVHSSKASLVAQGASGVAITESMVSSRDSSVTLNNAHCILIIEKDTFFQHLLQGSLLKSLPLVLVTGRGYPDVLTRRLLQRLHRTAPHVPQIYLGDYDPHGVAIFLLYLASCPWLRWLGMHRAEVCGFPPEAALPMTARDQALRASLLQRPEVAGNAAYTSEIQNMTQKFELEALHTVFGAERIAQSFIPEKILRRAWL